MSEETAAPIEGQIAPRSEAKPEQASWQSTLPDDYKGYVETKGWKEPSDMLKSYQSLEKLHGVSADKLLRLPDDPSKPGAMDPIYTHLGRPETADQYTNALGDGFDTGAFKAIAEQAHALGLADGQFQGLQKIVSEQSQALIAQQEQANIETFDKWKASNPDGFANAGRILQEAGMSEEGIAAMLSGDKTAIYDFAAKVGARTAETPVIHGDQPGGGFTLSPAQATAKISELMNDSEFMKQYTNANQKLRQPAIDRMFELTKIAKS